MTHIDLKMNLKGRVKRAKVNNPLIPLFEAVTNSIQSIEERFADVSKGKITIEILRGSLQKSLSCNNFSIERQELMKGFTVTDNGIGFNNRNIESFKEADSAYKESRGGKGIGRLSWLKFFEEAKIKSIFEDNGTLFKRKFIFSVEGINEEPIEETNNKRSESIKTKVKLSSIKCGKEINKDTESLMVALAEHFISYLATKSLPNLDLFDEEDKRNLNDFFSENFSQEKKSEVFDIKNKLFNVTSFRSNMTSLNNSLFLCGHKRVGEKIEINNLNRLVTKKFKDSKSESYAYCFFIESEYLDQITRDDREGFNFPNTGQLSMLEESITKEEIMSKAVTIIEQQLADKIESQKKKNLKNVKKYINSKAPQYRRIFEKQEDEIGEISSGNDMGIDQELRKIEFRGEEESREKFRALECVARNKIQENPDEFSKEWEKLMKELTEEGKSKLAGYILKRKMILDSLKKKLEINENNNYEKEKTIHNLIFPMKKTSDEINHKDQNLWIIDERLSFHHYLASDLSLGNKKDGHPDIIVFDKPIALNDKNDYEMIEKVSIIEFKRPGEDNPKGSRGQNDPVEQVLDYVKKIKEKKAKNRNGRQMETSESTSFFAYIICELGENLKESLKNRGMKMSPDEQSMYGYFEDRKAYIEVISYNKMISDSYKRNNILFQNLSI